MSASEARGVRTLRPLSDTDVTIDAGEVARFEAMAADWWNPRGSSALLHRINPVRLSYIRARALAQFDLDPTARASLLGLRALDVGCGAGILAEPLARMGAEVTGVDPADASIAAARAHAVLSGLDINYVAGSLRELPSDAQFDLVTCLEVAEHVADRDRLFLRIARLVRPGGLLIFSAPNRTPASWAAMILGAERLLRLLPRGTHDWHRFITPDEMREMLARVRLEVVDLQGLGFSPARGFELGRDLRVNYMGAAVPAAA